MKKDIAKKWVKALRSGAYKQARHALKLVGKNGTAQHCCLGVLCELYQKDQAKNKKKLMQVKMCPANELDADLPLTKKAVVFSKSESGAVLPKCVQRWAGLADETGGFKTSEVTYEAPQRERCESLAELNDRGASFKKIADVIEDAVEYL